MIKEPGISINEIVTLRESEKPFKPIVRRMEQGYVCRGYVEGNKIPLSLWTRVIAKDSDRTCALVDDQGRAWYGLGAKRHADLWQTMAAYGVKAVDNESTRISIVTDSQQKVTSCKVGFNYSLEGERAILKVMDIIPDSKRAAEISMNWSGGYKILGKPEYTKIEFTKDPSTLPNQDLILKVDKIDDFEFNVTYRIPNYPEDLKR